MATVIPYHNKNGKITSYQIQVFRGRDENGKKLKPYTLSWKVPETYKTEKAIKKALEKVVGEFETDCKRNLISIDKRMFKEYCFYYLELCRRDNSINTASRYENDLNRIYPFIGSIRLIDLTPMDLNKMYLQLQQSGIRQDIKAIANENLIALKFKQQLTAKKLHELTGLCDNTIRQCFQKRNISLNSAQIIANTLSFPIKDLFELKTLGDDTKGLSAKTIMNYHNMIHVILENARKEGVIKNNPANDATPPKVTKKAAEFLEIEDILKIKNALNSQPLKYRIMVYILMDTGIRRGELIGIRKSQIDFINNTILINNNIQWNKEIGLYAKKPKHERIRLISISPELSYIIKNYLNEQDNLFKKLQDESGAYNNDGYLFIQEESGKVMFPSTINIWMRKFENQNNLPHLYPHKFRHSQASILYNANIDPVTISNRLGHAQVSTTQNIYAHILKAADQKASNAVENILWKTSP